MFCIDSLPFHFKIFWTSPVIRWAESPLAGFIFMHPRLINMGYIGNALARAVGARKKNCPNLGVGWVGGRIWTCYVMMSWKQSLHVWVCTFRWQLSWDTADSTKSTRLEGGVICCIVLYVVIHCRGLEPLVWRRRPDAEPVLKAVRLLLWRN